MRRILLVSTVLLVAAAVTTASIVSRMRSGPDLPSGERTLQGLSGPVQILWDEYGIPQLWAETPRDALFAQGYVHATHRLWQVELFRRVAQGRLSELFGETTLTDDRFLRTLGMARAAERNAALLTDEERDLLEAYAHGLNAAVAGWDGWLPPEFMILGVEPEPYTLADVLALEKIMAFDLSHYGESLGLARLQALVGDEGLATLPADYPEAGLTILESAGLENPPEKVSSGTATPWGARAPVSADKARLALVDGALRPALAAEEGASATDSAGPPAFRFAEAVNAVRASNSWVIGPQRSVSGKPMVDNDMHLGLNRPAIWYLMGLHAPGLDVVGMSLPGTAGIVAGRTAAVAWGFTNAMVDDMELFEERLDPADSTRYLTPEGSEPFQVRTELIRLRGGAVDTLTVRTTRHGPVVTPVAAEVGGALLALRWVGHDASRTPAALLGMNRAGSAQEFLTALEGFSDPHQNVVFADTAGSWGYWMAGRIPDRPTLAPPLGPVPGWTGEYDWRGYLPFSEHPHALNPPSGMVVTANNRQTRTETGDRISGTGWFPPYRAERIAQRLHAVERHDVESLHAIHLDVTTLEGLRFAPLAARGFRAAGDPEAADLLESWDGRADLESVPAALFQAWYAGVDRRVEEAITGGADAFVPYRATLDRLDAGLPDDWNEAAAREALEAGLRPLGEAQTLRLDHPLSQLPVLQRLFGFAETGIPMAGTPVTVSPASRAANGEVRWGASQRHVSDLADLDAGGFVLPGGQSGYPAGPHSLDQLPLWLEGGLIPIPMTREGAEARAVERLTLRPTTGP